MGVSSHLANVLTLLLVFKTILGATTPYLLLLLLRCSLHGVTGENSHWGPLLQEIVACALSEQLWRRKNRGENQDTVHLRTQIPWRLPSAFLWRNLGISDPSRAALDNLSWLILSLSMYTLGEQEITVQGFKGWVPSPSLELGLRVGLENREVDVPQDKGRS